MFETTPPLLLWRPSRVHVQESIDAFLSTLGPQLRHSAVRAFVISVLIAAVIVLLVRPVVPADQRFLMTTFYVALGFSGFWFVLPAVLRLFVLLPPTEQRVYANGIPMKGKVVPWTDFDGFLDISLPQFREPVIVLILKNNRRYVLQPPTEEGHRQLVNVIRQFIPRLEQLPPHNPIAIPDSFGNLIYVAAVLAALLFAWIALRRGDIIAQSRYLLLTPIVLGPGPLFYASLVERLRLASSVAWSAVFMINWLTFLVFMLVYLPWET